HILQGFVKVFKGLSRALQIIRRSRGKQDAAQKLMDTFGLDEVQANAVLELQLYRISKLEIDQVLAELKEKKSEAKRIERILASKARLWKVVRTELEELADRFADRRRTSLGSSDEIAEFDAQAYIVRENTNVVVTREGWIKRVARLSNVQSTRVRDGDMVLDVQPGSTLDNVVIFCTDGVAYTLPIDRVPPSSGYGEPLSKHVRLGDGVHVVAAVTTDPRFTPEDFRVRGEPTPGPHLFVATALGQVLRISLSPFRTPSTKAGRKYCRLRKGDRVVSAQLIRDAKTVFLATRQARIIHFPIREVPVLAGPGKGVRGIKLAAGDEVLGATLLARPSDCLRVRNSNDRVLTFGQMKYNVKSRGGKGIKTSHRTGFEEILRPDIELVDWNQVEKEGM
ncbi:MAG: DNA topoisomerase, partial [Planctomycetes bacterium]|nr:DNA topoisomerase [Planctomycetota bacterium]